MNIDQLWTDYLAAADEHATYLAAAALAGSRRALLACQLIEAGWEPDPSLAPQIPDVTVDRFAAASELAAVAISCPYCAAAAGEWCVSVSIADGSIRLAECTSTPTVTPVPQYDWLARSPRPIAPAVDATEFSPRDWFRTVGDAQ